MPNELSLEVRVKNIHADYWTFLCFHIVGAVVQAQVDLPTHLAKALMLNDIRVKRIQVCNVL